MSPPPRERHTHPTVTRKNAGHIRPGDRVRAVVWAVPEQRWGPPTEVPYHRPARTEELAPEERPALRRPLRTPAQEIHPLYVFTLPRRGT